MDATPIILDALIVLFRAYERLTIQERVAAAKLLNRVRNAMRDIDWSHLRQRRNELNEFVQNAGLEPI